MAGVRVARFSSLPDDGVRPPPKPLVSFSKLQLIPHLALGGLFVATGQLHLLVVPMVTVPAHYFFLMGGIHYSLHKFNTEGNSALSLDKEETEAFK